MPVFLCYLVGVGSVASDQMCVVRRKRFGGGSRLLNCFTGFG